MLQRSVAGEIREKEEWAPVKEYKSEGTGQWKACWEAEWKVQCEEVGRERVGGGGVCIRMEFL